MGNQIIKILKTVGIVGIIIGAMKLLGLAINNLIPWNWLTSFFVLLRNMAGMFDFAFDTTSLFIALGIILTIEVSLVIFKATMTIVKWFR